jgi:carbonic anhydrase/acetyltransferase-like protein (isoleucine patch superfamily)
MTQFVSHKAWVAPSADIIGQVVIGENSSVWYQSVIRGDNDMITIGSNSNIQDGVIIHTDEGIPCTIGNYVTVGHRSIIHGAMIGHDVLVGMGSIIMNHVTIEENCLIAAGSLILENTYIPKNSLVMGFPAKVKRQLTLQEVDNIRKTALGYQMKTFFNLGITVKI